MHPHPCHPQGPAPCPPPGLSTLHGSPAPGCQDLAWKDVRHWETVGSTGTAGPSEVRGLCRLLSLPITCHIHLTDYLQPSKPSSNQAQQVLPAPGQLCRPGDWPHPLACSARPLGSRPSFSSELLEAYRQLTGSGAWRNKRPLKHKVSGPGCGLHSLP